MADAAVDRRKMKQLHVVFFPLLAQGHMLPLFDIARLFAARGLKATVVTTTCNAPVFAKALKNSDKAVDIRLEILKFPSEEVGLPAGIENFEDFAFDDGAIPKFVNGLLLLRRPLEEALQRLQPRPSCVVSDLFLPWTVEVAAEFGVPRVAFHGSSFFGMSVTHAMRVHKPFMAVETEEEEFVVPGIPGEVKLTRSRLAPDWKKAEAAAEGEVSTAKMTDEAFEAEGRSFGVIMNSFEELEKEYGDYYRKVMGRRTWSVGPVSLYNRSLEDKKNRGKKAAIDEQEIKRWLDSKPPNSVVYISFGSLCTMSSAQLREIAAALDSSDQYFIWVVRQPLRATTNADEDWLPTGFETRNRDKVLIIRGWSPQVMILDHEATGVFVTHCGWNSTLEGISAGVSMVTWPVFAEQFINEKLITDVFKVGVPTGACQFWNKEVEEVAVGREAIEAAIRRVTVGEEAEEIRSRARELKEKAWKAVEKGGSSYQGLSDLLDELSSYQSRDEY